MHTMSYEHILYERANTGIATLTLNDPRRRNAWTYAMCQELIAALSVFSADDSAKVLILTGAGESFCSGGNLHSQHDIEMAEQRTLGHAAYMRESMHALVLALHRLEKPTIAMIDGPAVAGGLALAVLCDFRIASDRARLGDPSGNAGLLPDEGGIWLWPRVMGLQAAMRMTLLGEIYDAPTALRLGLVGEVVPSNRLRERVSELAASLAARAPIATRVVKRLMRRSLTQSFEQSLGDIELAVDFVNNGDDAREGIAAFREKRPPRFKGS